MNAVHFVSAAEDIDCISVMLSTSSDANAHTVLLISCAINSEYSRMAAAASESSSGLCIQSIIAKDQEVLVIGFGMNALIVRMAEAEIDANKGRSAS